MLAITYRFTATGGGDLTDRQIEGHDHTEPDRVPIEIGHDGNEDGQKHGIDGIE